ncbi:hypothetical protein NQ317_010578 [Molorchus minor]|uniref:Peptidase M12B domain-containing protein n=1 Tax=Molorchus minor TaxID=1323400 RepID=A0ABQ9J5J8_9CUCU|nr:hypothetical protein NQ317_010578 [Molorchus minor]
MCDEMRYCLTSHFGKLCIAKYCEVLRDGNFTITYPKYTSVDEAMIAEDDIKLKPPVHRLHIKAPDLGQNFSVKLEPSPNILANNFILLETFANGSYPIALHEKDENCYFKGSQAAVSLCDGVRGIIYSNENDFYVIHPLPKRFHSKSSNPHLLVRKSHNKASFPTVPETCRHRNADKISLNSHKIDNSAMHSLPSNQTKEFSKAKVNMNKFNVLKRSKRETFPDGAPAFVETAVFVDRDLFDHMKINFPMDTERELIRFVLAMINAVQLLYHDPSLGRPVNFVLKRLEILKEEASGLVRPPDIDRFLSNFCNWQRTKNPVGDREPLHWDHALILTGLDLYVRGKHGKISSQVVGLAPVSGMCTASSSCTVNEGRHFESVYVVAHEIGHNLGMRHDGPSAENDCDPSSYIMSPTLGSGKITWSPCILPNRNVYLITAVLQDSLTIVQRVHCQEKDLMLISNYGRGSKHSTQQPLNDVCRDLHCERERYTWTSHPALEGTICGNNMWCRGGRCVVKGLVVSAAYTSQQNMSQREKINGGWSVWKPFSDCASGCLFGEEGRLRSGSTGIMVSERLCNNPRPQNNGADCEGPSTKYSTCNAQQCQKNVPRLTIHEFAEQICTRAKEVDKDLTGSGMQKISTDPEEACLVWCQKRNGSTKSRGWTFPDGTACQTRQNRYGKVRRCEEFVCDPYDEAAFVQSIDLCPIDKDDNEITWRIELRRREGVVKWKSASGCHYNCISPGSGIRLVMRKGKTGRSSIQLCQPDKYGCGRVKSPFQHGVYSLHKVQRKSEKTFWIGNADFSSCSIICEVTQKYSL